MKPKFILCFALVLISGLFGGLHANEVINVPVVSAPKIRECQETKTKDLGLWDDFFIFENMDSIILKKGDEIFSYSLLNSDFRKIKSVYHMAVSRIVDGVAWGNHQWLFYQSAATDPFAVDLATGRKIQFEIPEVKSPGKYSPAIHAIIPAGSEGGTIIEIGGDGVFNWPRDGNRSLYFWMSLESGKCVKFPTGWDLNYFSADQKRAVFENISTNAMMYRPWVTVEMKTGEVAGELPDQTKDLWSEPTLESWQASLPPGHRDNANRDLWQLRTPRTPMKLLNPQPGRGFVDDKFAGFVANSVACPFTMTNFGNARCIRVKAGKDLAAYLLQPDGGIATYLWVTQPKQNEEPILLATNCDFELLGKHRCAFSTHNEMSPAWPQGMVYDAESKTAWNILEGMPLGTNTSPASGGGTDKPVWPIRPNPISAFAVRPEIASGGGSGPEATLRLVPGFGSARFSAQILCLFSSKYVTQAYVPHPLPGSRYLMLLNAQGDRYQIKLPKIMSDLVFEQQFLLHNSGKLIFCQREPSSESSPQEQFHLSVVELHSQP